MSDDVLRVESDATDPRRFRLAGELDTYTGPTLEDRLAPALRELGDVTLDLRKLTFVDSSGIRALISIARALDGKLVLTGARASVQKVLDLVGLDRAPNIIIERASPR